MTPALLIAFVGVGAPPEAGLAPPIEMAAEGGIEVDLTRGVGRARGAVVIRARGVVVCCDEAEARYAAAGIERVRCRGHVVIRRAGLRIVADTVDFRAAPDRLELTGRVVVWRSDGRLTAERVTYDVAKDRLIATGTPSTFRFAPERAGPPPRVGRCPAPVVEPAPGPRGNGSASNGGAVR